MIEKVLTILKKKHIDLWWLLNVHTVAWYNAYRRYKLINKKLTQEEFYLLKEWLKK